MSANEAPISSSPQDEGRPAHCYSLLERSDFVRPNKLIKNQNASTTNADKLNLKINETIISSAPVAFSNE
jgi:hypothetical protein